LRGRSLVADWLGYSEMERLSRRWRCAETALLVGTEKRGEYEKNREEGREDKNRRLENRRE